MHQGEEEVSSETLRVGGCFRQMGRMLASPCRGLALGTLRRQYYTLILRAGRLLGDFAS